MNYTFEYEADAATIQAALCDLEDAAFERHLTSQNSVGELCDEIKRIIQCDSDEFKKALTDYRKVANKRHSQLNRAQVLLFAKCRDILTRKQSQEKETKPIAKGIKTEPMESEQSEMKSSAKASANLAIEVTTVTDISDDSSQTEAMDLTEPNEDMKRPKSGSAARRVARVKAHSGSSGMLATASESDGIHHGLAPRRRKRSDHGSTLELHTTASAQENEVLEEVSHESAVAAAVSLEDDAATIEEEEGVKRLGEELQNVEKQSAEKQSAEKQSAEKQSAEDEIEPQKSENAQETKEEEAELGESHSAPLPCVPTPPRRKRRRSNDSEQYATSCECEIAKERSELSEDSLEYMATQVMVKRPKVRKPKNTEEEDEESGDEDEDSSGTVNMSKEGNAEDSDAETEDDESELKVDREECGRLSNGSKRSRNQMQRTDSTASQQY